MNNTELREALELAALAAGLQLIPHTWDKGAPWGEHAGFTVSGCGPEEWNPAESDGDSRRLQVVLFIALSPTINHKEWMADHFCSSGQWIKAQDADPKLAILRAAALLGRRIKSEERAK
jgi:hypothetical protein